MAMELWLFVALVTYVIAASWGGAYYVFVANIGFSLFVQDTADIAGLYLDVSDMMFLVLAVGCGISRPFARSLRIQSAPHFPIWLSLAAMLTCSYIFTRSELLTDPMRAGYQVYRYCWKPILYYPIAAALTLSSPRRARGIATAIVVFTAIMSLDAVRSGTTTVVTGVFNHKNIFGAALVAPSVLASGLVIAQRKLFAPKWAVPSLGAIWLGIVLSGSRGAFVAAASASGLMLAALYLRARTRPAVTRIAILAGTLAISALVAFPQLMSSQGVKMLEELDQGTKVGNLQWRLTQRWPYFIAQIKAHPWVGTGELVGHSSIAHMTPHNGYLSVAYKSGVPASFLFSTLGILAVLRARRAFHDRELSEDQRILTFAFGCAVVGVLVHNIVEVTMQAGVIGQVFWIVAGAAASGHRERRNLVSRDLRLRRTRASAPRPTPSLQPRLISSPRRVTR